MAGNPNPNDLDVHDTWMVAALGVERAVLSRKGTTQPAGAASPTLGPRGPWSLETIVIEPDNPSVPVGQTQQFEARGLYAGGHSQPETEALAWKSSDESIVRFNDSKKGFATAGLKAGQATITARDSNTGRIGKTTLVVTPITSELSEEDFEKGERSVADWPAIPAGDSAEPGFSQVVHAVNANAIQHSKAPAPTPNSQSPSPALLDMGETVRPKGTAGPVKAGYERETQIKEWKIVRTDYGDLTISASAKIAPTIIGAGASSEPIRSNTTYSSKEKSGDKQGTIKQGFSYSDIEDLKLFEGLELKNPSVTAEVEFSATELTVAGKIAFTIVKSPISVPTEIKLILLKVKEGEKVKPFGIELKVAPVVVPWKTGSFETTFRVEFKASFMVSPTKIFEKIVKKELEHEGKKLLMKEVARNGGKLLTREAGELVLRDLGPLAAAFAAGWDIGELLNEFTIAPEVAANIYDGILGDLNHRFQSASTFGKMRLISQNSSTIAAAMVAAGFGGAVAGIGDLDVGLFKFFALDALPDFRDALQGFNADRGMPVTAALKAGVDKLENLKKQPLP